MIGSKANCMHYESTSKTEIWGKPCIGGGVPVFFVRVHEYRAALKKKTLTIEAQVGRYTLFKLKKHASPNNTQLVFMEGVFVQT